MKLQQDLRTLAGRVGDAERRGQPFLVVLGASCAEAARVPTLEQLASEAGAKVGPEDRRLIERLLWSVPVPSFYQDLANLARGGMFPLILTTGFDNLVERALYDLGLRAGHHFDIVHLAAGPEPNAETPDRPTSIRIVHATETPSRPIDPGALSAALFRDPSDPPLDVVVVGYRSEAPGLEAWLAAQPPGELWWVSDEQSPNMDWRGEVQELGGEDGAPETFFGKLALLLLRATPDYDPSAGYESSFEPLTSSGDDEVDYEFTRQRLERAKVVKGSIEQRVSSSGADPAAASQLEYQNREIAGLEQRLAKQSALETVDRMTAFRERLAAAVSEGSVPVDAGTLAFVDQQIEQLRAEADKDNPNRTIIVALQTSLDGLARDVGGMLDARSAGK